MRTAGSNNAESGHRRWSWPAGRRRSPGVMGRPCLLILLPLGHTDVAHIASARRLRHPSPVTAHRLSVRLCRCPHRSSSPPSPPWLPSCPRPPAWLLLAGRRHHRHLSPSQAPTPSPAELVEALRCPAAW
ncbi:hypothetical protein BS78_05G141600 [Paspalum vaginatum]|uniref:Uncharacterized protein n=1 Tax=Paspalum vaginatum TaxID=158149 RepID=A0A9W7XC56_9POAL|nr:hypothetical protein BS78_K032500 [Paspalum vaginatum]KAJ1275515.1 hypothetical protein BS78_05G141600 [Paspalum vaginatum]